MRKHDDKGETLLKISFEDRYIEKRKCRRWSTDRNVQAAAYVVLSEGESRREILQSLTINSSELALVSPETARNHLRRSSMGAVALVNHTRGGIHNRLVRKLSPRRHPAFPSSRLQRRCFITGGNPHCAHCPRRNLSSQRTYWVNELEYMGE